MGKGFIKASIGVTLIMAIGYILSFVKEAIIANYFGISVNVDAYTIAITIPVTLFAMVSVSIQSIVIPLYSDSLINEGNNIANSNISNFITVVSILVGIFILICELFASGIVYLFAPGFASETHELATQLLRLTTPTILFTVIERVFVGMLNVQGKYTLPSLSVCCLNIGLIACIMVFHAIWGIWAACVGQIVGTLMSLIYVSFLARGFYKYEFICSLKTPFISKTLKQSIPIIWSVSLGEVSAMINRIVASFLFVGSISALGYASKLNSVMLQFFTVAVATIIYPLYAESSAKKDMAQLNSRVNLTLSIYSFFLLPLMVGVFCFKEKLVDVAFGRGFFDQEAISITKTLLGIYAIGLLFMALRETITKVFYSLQDTKTPAKNATMAICTTILFNLVLPLFLGINGLALATALVSMIFSIRLIYQLCKLHQEIVLSQYFRNMPGILLSAFLMGVVLLVQNHFLSITNSFLSLIMGAVEGAVLYLILNYLFKTPVLRSCMSIVFYEINRLFKQ